MKEIARITIGLTISCLIAALVMGSVFAITDSSKKHNEHLNVQETLLELLGYTEDHPKPSELTLHTFYRYIIEDGEDIFLGYLLPVHVEGREAYELLIIDQTGKPINRISVPLSPDSAVEETDRDEALRDVLPSSMRLSYADSTIIAKLGENRLAYILPGEFPGFKTFIKVMLALNPGLEILGLEIMENEEDPGLGKEIEQEYFKNQFKGKTFENTKNLDVIKEPLPNEYRQILEKAKWEERAISKDEVEKIRSEYRGKDIYALTGATISSRAVTGGVKNIVKKFAYRLQILETVIRTQGIPVAF